MYFEIYALLKPYQAETNEIKNLKYIEKNQGN